MTTISSLSQLGWNAFFQQQLCLDDLERYQPVRVVHQHRSHLHVHTGTEQLKLPISTKLPPLTIGDWLLLDNDTTFHRLLDRNTCFTRKASGHRSNEQLIAANVDTALITTSLNQDFSLNRIERYLALVKESGSTAVVVLTKADICDSPEQYIEQVQVLDPLLCVTAVDARSAQSLSALSSWCRHGNTVAVLGSSGVGKSTLINSLLGETQQSTQTARATDGKGRHTTTSRSLLFQPGGCVLLDTPGIRELQLTDCQTGVEETFSDIETLAQRCKYANCQHHSEPNCAVQAAIGNQQLDQRRLENYRKLMREQANNSATLAEKRAKDRTISRFYRSVLNEANQRKKGC